MDKRKPIFEWQIVEQQAELQHAPWPPLVDTTSNVPPLTSHRYRRAIYGGVVAMLLLLAIAGGGLWYKAQAGLDQVEGELRTTVQTELISATQNPAPPTATSTTSRTSVPWQWQLKREDETLHGVLPSEAQDVSQEITVQMTNLQGDLAVAKIVVPGKDGSVAYRQTRFYHYTSAGWLRIQPVAELWGAPRRLESSHFIFLFRQNDAQVVAEVAPQMDALYTKVQHSFGLAPNLEKLVVEVTVESFTGLFLIPKWPSDPLVVPSPALYLAPAEVSDADNLAQSIALPLVEYMGTRVIEDNSIPPRWQRLQLSLQLQQLWNSETPVARWRQNLVKWLYIELPTAPAEQEPVLPEGYSRLCTMLRSWMFSPSIIGIPLTCSNMDATAWTQWHWTAYLRVTHLEQFSMPVEHWGYDYYQATSFPFSSIEAFAVATLMDYALSAYGDQKLPVFLAALAHYDTWDTLIPAVYGVSSSEFEEGWHRYLSEEYGIQEDSVWAGHKSSSP